MTGLTRAIAAAREALARLREHDGGTRYNGDDDDAGERACCLVASWKPHDSDCPHAVAVADFENLLAALDAAQGEAALTITNKRGEPVPYYAAPPAAPCVCGEPKLGVVHRADSPCYLPEQAPPAAVPAVRITPRDGKWTYSDNDEEFRNPLCSDELEAISDALDDLQETEVIYIAKAVQINPTRFVDADTILERIGELAYEECGESVDESWPELAPQERKELERLIADYVFTRSPATFYEIRDVQEFSRAEAEAKLAAALAERNKEGG